MPRPRCSIVAAVAMVGIGAFATGCGDDAPTSDAERFCGEAIDQQALIVAPPLGSDAELAATLDFYRLMGRLAPVAIADEWDDLVTNLETASTVVPGDPASEQVVAMTAYATERSAFRVATWLEENCGLRIPITTIAPQSDVPARTTTIAPPDGTDGTTPATSTPG